MTQPSADDRLHSTDTTSLSDMDLLALLVQHGGTREDAQRRAQALLSSFGDWVGLQRATLDELSAVAAMGVANAASVKAALDVGRRQLLSGPTQPLQITTPSDIAALLQLEMAALEKEHFRVVMLNTKNHLIGIDTVTIGCVDSASVRIAEVFRAPIRKQASSIILAHNHPTGDVTASPEDVLLTRQIIQAGQIMEIAVLDHLIIGQGRWASLRTQRLGWRD